MGNLKIGISTLKGSIGPAIVAGAVGFGVLALIAAATGEGSRTLQSLGHMDGRWIVAAISCQVSVYVCVAAILKIGLGEYGHKVAGPYLLYGSFAFLFANRALPGPAIAGLATLTYLLRRKGVEASAAQAAAAIFYLADYISFFVLGLGAMVVIAPALPLAMIRVLEIAGMIIIAGFVAVAFASRSLRSEHHGALHRACTRLELQSKHPGLKSALNRGASALQAFSERWKQITEHPRSLIYACGAGLAMHGFECFTLVCAGRGFGARVPFAPAAGAYVAANLAAIVSFLPGGVGFFEASMVTVLKLGAGLSMPVCLAIAALYRILSIWAPAPAIAGLLREVRRKEAQD
jgi:hypothetical protein